MTNQTKPLPRPVDELAALAEHYDTHDTSSEMEHGEWVDPRPMKTTSLRLPAEVVDALKTHAQARGLRYTAFLREVLEQAVSGTREAELAHFEQRLGRIERRMDLSYRQARVRVAVTANLRHHGLVHRTLAGRHG